MVHPTPVQNNVRFSFSGPPPSVVLGPPPGMAVTPPIMASPLPGMTLISQQPPLPLMSINTQPTPAVPLSGPHGGPPVVNQPPPAVSSSDNMGVLTTITNLNCNTILKYQL